MDYSRQGSAFTCAHFFTRWRVPREIESLGGVLLPTEFVVKEGDDQYDMLFEGAFEGAILSGVTMRMHC